MLSTPPALLDALADCLEAGDTLYEALGKVEMAGGAAEPWVRHVRSSVRAGDLVAGALRSTNVLSADELSLLSAEGDGALAAACLHTVAQRRRRSFARRRAIAWGLVAPFLFAAMTVVLDPLPNLITGDPFFWPVARGLIELLALVLALTIGLPALLRGPRTRAAVLRVCGAVPGLRWFAAMHAEEELVAALVPFVDGGSVTPAGLTAAASLLAWSRVGEALRVAARPPPPPGNPLPLGGLQPLVRELSLGSALAVVGGVASKHLAQRLGRRGDEITALLTARLRLLFRIGAYALVVALSISSLVGMISRGLPGMPTLPGGEMSPDQKELEDIMKQLGQ